MNIKKPENQTGSSNFEKYVGVGQFNVIALNPSKDEVAKIYGRDVKEDGEEPIYMKETKDRETMIICAFYLQNVQDPTIILPYRVNLIDKIQESKSGKTQYINQVGDNTYVDHVDNLTQRFLKFTTTDKNSKEVAEIGTKSYREAHSGEAELHGFIKAWVNLDQWNPESDILLDWKKLVKGNLSEIKTIIGSEYAGSIVAMAEVKPVEKEGNTIYYQGICGKAFLAERLSKGGETMPQVRNAIANNKWTGWDLENFYKNIGGEFGSKNIISWSLLKKFDPSEHLAATNEPLQHSETPGDTDY